MARDLNRNSSLTFFVILILILILAIAFTARAQVAQAPIPLKFRPAVAYESGGFGASSVALGDLNGDGKLDIVVANSCISYDDCPYNDILDAVGHGTLGVFLGKGDGTFRPAVTYDSGGYVDPVIDPQVALADLNRDGKLDIIVTNSCGDATDCPEGTVSVLFGIGDGTFQLPLSYGAVGWMTAGVAVGDVNGDGNLDLLTANTCWYHSECDEAMCTCPYTIAGVLINDGHGGFGRGLATAGVPWGRYVTTGDVNGDGNLDLVMVHDASVNVLLGDGHLRFVPAYSTDNSKGRPFVLGDINGDNKLDQLVFTGNGTIGIMDVLSNGGRIWSGLPCGSGLALWSGVALGDLNLDGKLDVVLPPSVYPGNGDGTFQPAVTTGFSANYMYPSIAIGDVNGDGKPDIVITGTYGDSVSVLINDGGATTTTIVTSSLNPSFVSQAVTFKATTWAVGGFPADGEAITFKNGADVLGTALLKGGVAYWSTSSLPVGTFNITASYVGNSKLASSTSAALRQLVKSTTKAFTTTTLASSVNPSMYGQAVTWMAMVTTSGSVAPTGNVVFRWSRDGQNYAIGTAPLNANGVATLTRSNLNANPFGEAYPLVAAFSGDAGNLGSASTVLPQTVLQTKSTATITSSLNPSTLGRAVTLTAKITAPGIVVTGPVTFSLGPTKLGPVQLSGGVARFTTSALPGGADRVTVIYYGSSNIAKSSASLVQTVQ
jgi:hypothetical protein